VRKYHLMVKYYRWCEVLLGGGEEVLLVVRRVSPMVARKYHSEWKLSLDDGGGSTGGEEVSLDDGEKYCSVRKYCSVLRSITDDGEEVLLVVRKYCSMSHHCQRWSRLRTKYSYCFKTAVAIAARKPVSAVRRPSVVVQRRLLIFSSLIDIFLTRGSLKETVGS